ncbi:hypothetical protein SUGI_0599870 [Cryptomeria japonica]|nr:hypothetical protein SUGI_0599870 [Cryptomeria japonica]
MTNFSLWAGVGICNFAEIIVDTNMRERTTHDVSCSMLQDSMLKWQGMIPPQPKSVWQFLLLFSNSDL